MFGARLRCVRPGTVYKGENLRLGDAVTEWSMVMVKVFAEKIRKKNKVEAAIRMVM